MSNRFFTKYPGYIVTSPFGQRIHPVTRVKKMHNGVDLVATKDGKTGQVDKIKAHTGGTVSAVGYDTSAGNFVQIKVASDTVMVYYHLRDKPTLKVGDTVKTGQIIGTMGKTGNVTGAHLHWGIKKAGQWIDPAPYLDKDYAVPVKTVAVDLPVLKRGAKGESVRALQALLVGYGYKIVVDGSFGAKTDNAVKCYQEDTGLAVDGSVGRATWSSLLGV